MGFARRMQVTNASPATKPRRRHLSMNCPRRPSTHQHPCSPNCARPEQPAANGLLSLLVWPSTHHHPCSPSCARPEKPAARGLLSHLVWPRSPRRSSTHQHLCSPNCARELQQQQRQQPRRRHLSRNCPRRPSTHQHLCSPNCARPEMPAARGLLSHLVWPEQPAAQGLLSLLAWPRSMLQPSTPQRIP